MIGGTRIAPSLMCMDLANVAGQLAFLDTVAEAYHVDIMDGHFAKNLALSPDFVKTCRNESGLPIDAHVMADEPWSWVEPLALAGATTLSVHAETIERMAFRLFGAIRDVGCSVGVAVNPATPLTALEAYLEEIDVLTIMTVDVGYAGQAFISPMLRKVRSAAQMKAERGLSYTIQVDGACNAETYAPLIAAGAEQLVLGSSGLFGLDDDISRAWRAMAAQVGAAQQMCEEAAACE